MITKENKLGNLAEFEPWAIEHLSDRYDARFHRYVETVLAAAAGLVAEHPFVTGIDGELERIASAESTRIGSQLLMPNQALVLNRKSFRSVLSKCFRVNIVSNTLYPNPPEEGWITPDNVFTQVNDLVRGTLVCRYADGPEVLAQELSKYATSLGLESRFYAQGKDDGYYAYHFYVYIPVQIPNLDFAADLNVNLSVEIQITTQLQDVLREFTHEFYEQNREHENVDKSKWKWALDSQRFRAGYLSHTLHLLEAIIVQLRNESMQAQEKEQNND